VKSKQSKFAVFDIDGTLYRWQLFHELVQELTLANVFPDNTYRDIDQAWNDWRGGSMSFHDYEMLVVETLQKYLPLIPVEIFEAACDKVVAQSAHKLHAYPRQLLKDLKAKGYVIIAISGSQQELLERFGAKHGFDIVIGAFYERKNGHFTGKTTRMTIGRKHEILHELIEERYLTTKESVAIGDSDGDISILELAERPIAFNPSEGLFEHAKTHGWSIVVERKNIAYRLEKQNDALVLAETIAY
jgi:HAD superfamily hydrolase (TIGR01490 family)